MGQRKMLTETGMTLSPIPSWQQKMTEAAFDGICESDITDIVRKQVEQAKAGDSRAAKFVFDVFVNTKKPDGREQPIIPSKPPAESTKARPGSQAKILAMQQRAQRGEATDHPDDVDHS